MENSVPEAMKLHGVYCIVFTIPDIPLSTVPQGQISARELRLVFFYCNSRALEREPGLHSVLTLIANTIFSCSFFVCLFWEFFSIFETFT
jgi:hypothetical protein